MKSTDWDIRSFPWDGYPITIVKDRYTGTYSEGEWIAFGLDPAAIPTEPFEDDVTAAGYWCAGEVRDEAGPIVALNKNDMRHPRFVGRGRTPEEAKADLKRRHGSKGRKRGRRTKP